MNEKKKLRRLPKRILSFVLTLAMVLTLMPAMSVYAAEIDCPNCSGSGIGWCAKCDTNPRKCSSCDDSGKTTCSHCEDGYVVTGICNSCNGNGTTTISTGLTMKCANCMGRGKEGYNCVFCSGSGKTRCDICNGT